MFKVLDVSCFDPSISDRAHALTGALVKASARTIEKRFLREGGTAWRSGLAYRRGGLRPVRSSVCSSTLKTTSPSA